MGYYSQYELTVIKGPSDILIPVFRNTYPNASFAINENGRPENDSKWYDSEGDLRSFSKMYPLCIFKLHRIGQEGEFDDEVIYVQDGKIQRSVLKIPEHAEFDPKLLTD